MDREYLILKKDWGRYKAGARLCVWHPGDELLPGMVDPRRAATLRADGIAVLEGEAPAKKARG